MIRQGRGRGPFNAAAAPVHAGPTSLLDDLSEGPVGMPRTVRARLAETAVPSPRPTRRRSWLRLLRMAVTGLVAGATVGFLAALLRPRRWFEYVEPQAVSRT